MLDFCKIEDFIVYSIHSGPCHAIECMMTNSSIGIFSLLHKPLFYLWIFTVPGTNPGTALHTPYSKMATIQWSFVCLQISPCCLVLKLEIQKNIFPWTTRANLQANKRTLKWRPFWNKVYTVFETLWETLLWVLVFKKNCIAHITDQNRCKKCGNLITWYFSGK